jgi:hypothetical protein
MRVALVADVHGNLTALEAVAADLDRQNPDLVVHGGDLALMGARPAEVIDRTGELGWRGVVGNTYELLWRRWFDARHAAIEIGYSVLSEEPRLVAIGTDLDEWFDRSEAFASAAWR